VHADIIGKTVDSTFSEVDEEKQAREYLRRKRLRQPTDQKQAAKIFRQLLRAGFTTKTIFKILKNWNIDDDTLTAFETEAAE
jgi:regulatory protein